MKIFDFFKHKRILRKHKDMCNSIKYYMDGKDLEYFKTTPRSELLNDFSYMLFGDPYKEMNKIEQAFIGESLDYFIEQFKDYEKQVIDNLKPNDKPDIK